MLFSLSWYAKGSNLVSIADKFVSLSSPCVTLWSCSIVSKCNIPGEWRKFGVLFLRYCKKVFTIVSQLTRFEFPDLSESPGPSTVDWAFVGWNCYLSRYKVAYDCFNVMDFVKQIRLGMACVQNSVIKVILAFNL